MSNQHPFQWRELLIKHANIFESPKAKGRESDDIISLTSLLIDICSVLFLECCPPVESIEHKARTSRGECDVGVITI